VQDAATPAPGTIRSAALRTTLRWVLILASLLAVGPLVAELFTFLRDVDGGRAVTLLVNGSPGVAFAGAAVLIFATLCVGLVAARFFSLGTALFCAGAVVAWAGSRLGSLESIVRRAGEGKDLFALAVEGLLVTAAAAGAAALFVRVGGAGAREGSALERALYAEPEPVQARASSTAAALGAAALAAGAAVWFVALSGARMQTLAATVAGGIAAGGVAHLLHAHRRLTPVLPMAAMALVALAGPLAAYFMEGTRLAAHVYDGSVLSLARPVSLDWAAGALIGVPLGLNWAGASAERRSR